MFCKSEMANLWFIKWQSYALIYLRQAYALWRFQETLLTGFDQSDHLPVGPHSDALYVNFMFFTRNHLKVKLAIALSIVSLTS